MEERASIDVQLEAATNGAEQAKFVFSAMTGGAMAAAFISLYSNEIRLSMDNDLAAAADLVRIGGYEISAGHRALAIGTEEVEVVAMAAASTHKYPVRINGATRYLLMTNV